MNVSTIAKLCAIWICGCVAVLQPDPTIVDLLATAQTMPDDAAIVTTEQQILGMLIAAGLAWTGRRIHHRQVGIHKCNRHGFGVSWSRMHRLGSKIFRLGFSWLAANQCVCFEDDDDQSNAKFTVDRQSTSDGFGKQTIYEIKYAAVAGNHLNQLEVAIDQAVATQFPNLADQDGKMSKEKIEKKDPFWKDALQSGLEWTVLHKEVAKLYPTLPNLIQRARNAVSQNQSGESIIEMLLEIYSIASSMESQSGKAANWESLCQIVLQSEPPFADAVPSLCNWAIKYGGHSLESLTEFVTVCVPSDREINPDVFTAVTKWPTAVNDGKGTQAELAMAIIMGEYNCPTGNVVNGVTSFFKPSKIASLPSSMKDDMYRCNELMQAFKAWITTDVNLESRWNIAYVGKAYSLLARMLLDQAVPEEMQDQKLETGLYAIASQICDLPPQSFVKSAKPPNLTNPWDSFRPKKKETDVASARVASAAGDRLIKYDNGDATQLENRMLASHGFALGVRVSVKEGKPGHGTTFVIKSIEGDGSVKLKRLNEDGSVESGVIKSSYTVFMSKYELAQGPQTVYLPYPQHDINDSVRIKMVQAEADVTKAMCTFYTSQKTPQIKITMKPTKSIVAEVKAGKERLCIPVFGKVVCIKLSDSVPDRSFEVKDHIAKDTHRFFIKPVVYNDDDDDYAISPAAYIQYVKEEEDATANVVYKAVNKLKVPAIVNIAPLDAGDEVTLYTPEKQKVSAKTISIDCGIKKKPRTN